MSGVSSIVHNYRKLKNENRSLLKGRNKLRSLDYSVLDDSSIHKLQTKMFYKHKESILDVSKQYDSTFVFIYRQNLFEKALAWYDHHVVNDSLDPIYIKNWLNEIKIHETKVFNYFKDKVDLFTITYENVYVDSYDIMINTLKILNLDLDYKTAELFRYTNTKAETLDGKYNWKPELDIHRNKPGFDICYDMLCDERITFT